MAESWAGGLNTGLLKGFQIGSMLEEGKARKEAREKRGRDETRAEAKAERDALLTQIKAAGNVLKVGDLPDEIYFDNIDIIFSNTSKLMGKAYPGMDGYNKALKEDAVKLDKLREQYQAGKINKSTYIQGALVISKNVLTDPVKKERFEKGLKAAEEDRGILREQQKRLATQLIVEFQHNKARVEPGSVEAKELSTNFYTKLKEIHPEAVGAATDELKIILSGEGEGATMIPYEREKPLTTAQRKSEWAEMRAEELREENRWSEREITGMVLTELNQKFPSKTGTDVTVNLGTSTKQHLEKEIIDADSSIANFDSIESSFNPAFLTYGGKLKAGTQRVLDKAGFASNTQFLEERATWFSQAMSAFIAYRKWATGVAGGEKELAQIAKAYPDPEKNSPAEYKANLKQSRITARKLKIRLSMFRLAGIDNPTKAQLASIPLGSIPDPLAKKNIDIGDRNLQDLSDRELQELKQ